MQDVAYIYTLANWQV